MSVVFSVDVDILNDQFNQPKMVTIAYSWIISSYFNWGPNDHVVLTSTTKADQTGFKQATS